MIRQSLVGAVIAVALAAGVVQAADTGYTAAWSSAPSVEGFTNPSGEITNPGTGGNPGGFLRATRTGSVNVNVCPIPFLREDLGKTFGTGAGTISFDVKALDSYEIPEIHLALTDGSSSFTYIITTQNVVGHPQTAVDGWVHYSIPWQATWDNAEAIARKWRIDAPTGEWAKVIKTPKYSVLSVIGSGKGPTNQTVGIDNFRIDAGAAVDPAKLAPAAADAATPPGAKAQ